MNERKRKKKTTTNTYFPDNTQSNGIQYTNTQASPLFHQTYWFYGAHKKLPYKSKWEKRLKKINKKY